MNSTIPDMNTDFICLHVSIPADSQTLSEIVWDTGTRG
jgi:hypothetical protein